jgi:anti-anti-sigma factor
MHIEITRDQELEDGLVVRLDGALEIGVVDRLWQTTSERVGKDARFFLFDFSDVTIITSAGIGTLVRLLIRLRGVGGSMAIFGCSDKICEVFDIVMLKKLLQVCDSEAEARRQLVQARSS